MGNQKETLCFPPSNGHFSINREANHSISVLFKPRHYYGYYYQEAESSAKWLHFECRRLNERAGSPESPLSGMVVSQFWL